MTFLSDDLLDDNLSRKMSENSFLIQSEVIMLLSSSFIIFMVVRYSGGHKVVAVTRLLY